MAEQLISTSEHDTLPDSYVRPETQRPRLHEVVPDAEIPVVDLADPDRAAVVARVAEACRTHGFFQVLNHGVPEELTAAMLSVAYEFFRLPAEEKAKLYSDDPGKKMRLSTSFNVRKETVHNWRDYLRLHCYPLEQYVPDWPDNPPSFRKTTNCHGFLRASCGPETQRNPTRRTESASCFSSLRFASAPSNAPPSTPPPMATAVPAASLRAPSSSPVAAARRLGAGAPSLRKRHCAVAPVAAACGPAPPRQLDNEEAACSGRRQVLLAGAAAFLSRPNPAAFAAEAKKGFLPVVDKKAGYSFLYPFGWEEVAVQGQDKVYKDVIEPLESVSVNSIPTSKEDIRDLGPPDKVAEALIKKVLAPPTQKTKLIEAKENDVDGRAYYTFEFTAQAPNYTRHALGAIVIANGKFYTLTTGANERRWEKMKDRLYTVVDSFKIENRI